MPVSMSQVHQVPLLAKFNNGKEMPILGLGTWQSKPGEVAQAVKDAIDAGYRHIDGAYLYQNESEVGQGIKAKLDEGGVVTREELFVTSKLWSTLHRPELVEPAIRSTLHDLGLEYLDLYLMHSPWGSKEGGELFPRDDNGVMVYSDVTIEDTWRAMEELVRKGLARSIGLSNFNSEQVNRVFSIASILPVVNQVECHPYLSQRKLVDFCKSKNIVVTAYSPFGSPDRPWAAPHEPVLLEDPILAQIGKKHSKSVAQVILRWMIQRGVAVIPKSVNKDRIRGNFEVFDFHLSEEDMEAIYGMNRNWRAFGFRDFQAHKDYPFNIEF